MLFGKAVFEQGIVDGASGWNVNNAAGVYVTSLGAFSEAEFAPTEPMWMDGNVRPSGDFVFELAKQRHDFQNCWRYGCRELPRRFNLQAPGLWVPWEMVG